MLNEYEIHTIEDIELLKESHDLECKKAGGHDDKGKLPGSFWETYSSMANTDGGVILLGVQEKKGKFSVFGIRNLAKVRKSIIDSANDKSKVSVNLLTNNSIQDVPIDGKVILRVDIPRAKRAQRPVYLNGNPLGGHAYVRLHEADQRLSDDVVKRYLAEQVEDSRDNRILKGYYVSDLSAGTLRAYRQVYANLKPEATWNTLDDKEYLVRIGGWRHNRETGEQGLTLAGLLMFGTHPIIQEVLPHYMLDYQERPEAKTEQRWIDRVTLDGSWSGNLYDYYRKAYAKLTADLKVPFELDGDQRKENTPVHVAIREALCNVLVHADYSDRASVLVVKRPDMFGFRNPGLMRIPPHIAMQGGEPDCRNRILHRMFRYVGIGDQGGTGIPKILDSWKHYHWRPPSLTERHEPYDQTLLEMRMLDLFPEGVMDRIRRYLGDDFGSIDHAGQVALAIALTEGTVNHDRLKDLTTEHSSDLSRTLRDLTQRGLLEQTGIGRGAVYHLSGFDMPSPEDVFDSISLSPNSTNLNPSTTNLNPSTTNLNSSTTNLGNNPIEKEFRDNNGCLISEHLTKPVIDNLEKLGKGFLADIEQLVAEPRDKKRIPEKIMKEIIKELCRDKFVTISCLAKLLNRNVRTLRSRYLSKMVKNHDLDLAFPKTPSDPRQAYTTS
ncbi:RNA-binding domain-containing protein [Candidatus Margulisiibacteriota bacterium]